MTKLYSRKIEEVIVQFGVDVQVVGPQMTRRKGKIMKMKSLTILALVGLAAVHVMLNSASVVFAQSQDQDQMRYHRDAEIDKNAHPVERPYSPWVDQNFPQRPLFGDTHLHTAQSFDAVSFGTSLGPEEAYRFARGEEVTSSTGVRGRLSRPLDFLVVADHAENMGTMGAIKDGLPEVITDPTVRKWHKTASGRW